MKLKATVVGLAALGGIALTAGPAAAMPNGLPQAGQITGHAANVEQVRLVCNRFGRCWHRPGPRVALGWGPRRVWRPGWRGAYALGPAPAWGPGPVWGPRQVWGPRPGWGWGGGWNGWGW